ncbi:MAG: dienelactone hydrolase family protein [Halobacteriales archaeon]|nr:dienelactone hydrolase family protein [Halobacteriales archaeon]
MGTEEVVIPGGRDVRGTLETPTINHDRCVVACPPHPQQGGTRNDQRLQAIADALVDRGVAALRFDYGAWDKGHGELTDAENAVAWAAQRYGTVGIFGFSFGGCIALLTAAQGGVGAVSTLAPAARLGEELDAVTAFDSIACPIQIVYGTRDTTATWEPVVERARASEATIVEMSADHFFIGQERKLADTISDFLATRLEPPL